MVYGVAGQVDGLVRRIAAELGRRPRTVIATGGLAPLVLAGQRDPRRSTSPTSP